MSLFVKYLMSSISARELALNKARNKDGVKGDDKKFLEISDDRFSTSGIFSFSSLLSNGKKDEANVVNDVFVEDF
jgi:hypothetical protein